MLLLDALDGDGPTHWANFTTSDATLDLARFYRGRELVMRALKRRWPEARYASQLEYTTGYTVFSGGKRRPHWHTLLKGIPVEATAEAAALAVAIWCRHVNAAPEAQYFAALENAAAAIKYTIKHFGKDALRQRPPKGFHGRRFFTSRNYFAVPVPAQRQRAKEALSWRSAVRRARAAGLDAYDAELAAHESMKLRASTTWTLANSRGVPMGPRSPAEAMQWRLWLSRRTDPAFEARADHARQRRDDELARIELVQRRDEERQAALVEALRALADARTTKLERLTTAQARLPGV
jgi:hypothetical protein